MRPAPLERFRDTGHWWALLAILLVAVLVRGRLLDVPLERDEGEYAYAAQLLLRGEAPYASFYSMKLPGVYFAYAVSLLLFGQTSTAVHLGLLLVNVATIVLVFLLGRRLYGSWAGVVSAASFAVLSPGLAVQGLFANTEQFINLAALAGFLLLLVATEGESRAQLFAAGLLLGLAPVMKQTGALLIAAGALYFVFHEVRHRSPDLRRTLRRGLLLAAGMLTPTLLVVLFILLVGVYDEFRYWTLEVAASYATDVQWRDAWSWFTHRARPVFHMGTPLWILALLGLATLAREHGQRPAAPFLALYATAAAVAVCPGLYFRPHYFAYLLPPAALLVGAAVTSLDRLRPAAGDPRIRRWALALAVLLALGWPLVLQHDYLFRSTPEEISRRTFGAVPFAESPFIAEQIRRTTQPGETIAILGSEPQILFYSQRRSATRYIYVYPLMSDLPAAGRMQQEMIDEIEQAEPAMLLFVSSYTSWLRSPDSPDRIFEWFEAYARTNYDAVGLVEIVPGGAVRHWAPAPVPAPRGNSWVLVLRRVASRSAS